MRNLHNLSNFETKSFIHVILQNSAESICRTSKFKPPEKYFLFAFEKDRTTHWLIDWLFDWLIDVRLRSPEKVEKGKRKSEKGNFKWTKFEYENFNMKILKKYNYRKATKPLDD